MPASIIERQCAFCNKRFLVRRYTVTIGKGRFCSRACFQASRGTPEQRFWKFVDKTGDCWLWTGSINPNGYGTFTFQGKTIGAHIFSRILHSGPIPAGCNVLHRCDIRKCVRPDHLFAGTQQENIHDCIAKGRHRPGQGERHGRHKTNAQRCENCRQRA